MHHRQLPWGGRPFDFVHPDDLDKTTQAYEGQLKHGEPVLFFRNRYLRKDGTPVSLEWTAKPDLSSATIFAIGRDMTARDKLVEEERTQLTLLHLADDAIIVTDPEGHVTFWNRGAETTYGWSADEAIGRVTDELLGTIFPIARDAVDVNLIDHGQWRGELTHVTRDGRSIVVASRWSLQRDAQGIVTAVLQINRDVTERRLADEKLRLAAVELMRSTELVDFASIASHDLQEPLRKIQTFSGDLDRYAEALGDEGRDRLRRLQGAAARMTRLINALLTLSRVTTKARPFTDIDLACAARNAVSNLETRIQETGGQVEISASFTPLRPTRCKWSNCCRT